MSDFKVSKIYNGYALNKYIGSGGAVVIPDDVTYIAHDAFHDCTSLTSIMLSEYPLGISANNFYGCTNLTEIKVPENNPDYTSKDGVLFCQGGKALVAYPVGNPRTEYVIPEGVTCIRDSAFRECNTLTSVVIPNSVKKIEISAFCFCSNLEKIQFPECNISIEENAFSGTPWLEHYPDDFVIIGNRLIKYKGNQKEIIVPDNVSYFTRDSMSEEIIICYHGVKFSSEYVCSYNIMDRIRKLIDTKDFNIQMSRFIKENIFWSMFLANPEDEFICKRLKKTLYSRFRQLVEHSGRDIFQDEVEILQKLLDSGEFVTKDNIDQLIQYTIKNKKYELQMMLMDYKYKNIDFSDPSDKLKL